MRILICTAFSLDKPSAGLNKMKDLISALKLYGVETYISGFKNQDTKFKNKNYQVKGEKIFFKFNEKIYRHSKSLSINVNTADFYHKNLDKIIKELSIDLIIVYSTFSTLIEPIIKISRKNKIKVTAYVGELFNFSLKYLFNGVLFMQYKAFFFSFKLLDGLICASPSWQSYSQKINKKSVLLPTFINVERFQDFKKSKNKNFRIVLLSNLSKREHPVVLIDAMREIEKMNGNVELYILADKPKYSLVNLRSFFLRIKLIRLKKIIFTGFLNNYERDKIMSSADCFVLLRSPDLESKFLFPVRIGEYFSATKPLIISCVNPFNKFFEHKKEVFFINRKNKHNELVDAILELKSNTKLSKKISNNARKYGVNYFSKDFLGLQVLEFLKNILNE